MVVICMYWKEAPAMEHVVIDINFMVWLLHLASMDKKAVWT